VAARFAIAAILAVLAIATVGADGAQGAGGTRRRERKRLQHMPPQCQPRIQPSKGLWEQEFMNILF
jgi:hypothetical protein